MYLLQIVILIPSLSREDKMMGYINKITIRFQTYISYMQNKALK